MKRLLAGCAIAALAATAAYAQETSTTIRGTVMANNAPVANAAIEVTHVPSGTTQRVTTTADGGFALNGLRPGGPYTVKITADGFESTSVTDVYTSLGTPFTLPITLESQGQEIVVTARKVRGAGLTAAAATTTLNAEAISRVASVNRDFRDLARRSPLVDVDYGNNRALTFAGKNPRFNLYTIDGVSVNDSYGLNVDGSPTKAGPVPLEAIEQFSAMVAPYDATYGLFQGGVVNSVLKSGTNKFHGNFFYTYTDDGLTGDKIRDQKVDLSFKNRDRGFEIDGPIIKDRLFFMLSAERITQGTPFSDGPADGGFASVIPNLTMAQVTNITNISNTVYGYDPGPIVTSEPQKSEFVTGKIDANISDTQHLSLTWINAYDVTPTSYDTSTSTSSPGLGLRSHYYSTAERLHAGIARLNSQWSDNFSTEIRAIYKNYKQPADPLMGKDIGMFTVCTDTTTTTATGAANTSANTTCTAGSPRLQLGPDQYRHANLVENEIRGGYVAANLTAGNHDFKVNAEAYDHWVYNLFVAGSLGVWTFDTVNGFQNQHATSFSYTNATTGDPNDAAVDFHYQTYALGAQDHWQVTPDLSVLLSARYDLWGGHDRPAANAGFLARQGYSNTLTYDGLGVFQPRLSVNWKATPRLQFNGGFGKFAAGNPDIYIANSFGNTGVLSRSATILETTPGNYTINGVAATTAQQIAIAQAALNNVNGKVPDAVKSYIQGLGASAATINALDPDFKVPSEWRGTLSADYRANLGPLGDGWNLGGDFFYTKTIKGIGFYDARSVPTGLTTPDGRPRYTAIDGTTLSDIILTNFNKGRSYVGVVRFDKSWDWGLSVGASYTWEDVKDNAAATSSQATSLYRYTVFADPNVSAYGISNDQIKWQVKWHLDFDHAFYRDYKTKLSLFGTTQAGRPFSYTMAEGGSGSRSASFGTVLNTSNYLLYVPTGINDPLITYAGAGSVTASQLATQLDNYINASVLSKYRGQIAPRNIDRSKSRTRLDLHIEQEIPTFVGRSRLSFFADAENFLNLLNSKWGIQEQVPFSYSVPLVKVQCITAAGAISTVNTACAKYQISPNASTGISTPNQSLTSPIQNSLYLIRIGVRFKF
jgi:hypothetical protein